MHPDWEELRDKLGAAARSPALAADFAAALPARPRILNIAAGSGELLRWLAPRLHRAQMWLLADDNEVAVAGAFEESAAWATRRGWMTTFPGRAMLVHMPSGPCRIEGFALEREAMPDGLPLDRVDAVVCSALLDRVSPAWLERLLGAVRVPLLACLVANGRIEWLPRQPADRIIRAGLARAWSEDRGYGQPPAARAPEAVIRALRLHGWTVRSAASDISVPAAALAATRGLVVLAASGARATLPAKAPAIAEWEAQRLRQTLAARLAVRIGQRDILGLPRQART